MHRVPQVLLIVTTFSSAWLLMQAVHEAGHLTVAIATGAAVERVVLHPLTISRTDVSINPYPLAVCWGGPILGAAVPLLIWLASRACRLSITWWTQFFAGFCLIANGAYLMVGVRDRIGDAGDLLTYGAAAWQLVAFGVVTIPAGLALWNGLGPQFGLGAGAQSISWRAALWSSAILVITIVLELQFGQ